jgi:hypothetical protein
VVRGVELLLVAAITQTSLQRFRHDGNARSSPMDDQPMIVRRRQVAPDDLGCHPKAAENVFYLVLFEIIAASAVLPAMMLPAGDVEFAGTAVPPLLINVARAIVVIVALAGLPGAWCFCHQRVPRAIYDSGRSVQAACGALINRRSRLATLLAIRNRALPVNGESISDRSPRRRAVNEPQNQ